MSGGACANTPAAKTCRRNPGLEKPRGGLDCGLPRSGRSGQKAAAEALGKIGDPKAVPVMIKLFRDTSKIVRETAGTALVYIGEPSADLVVDNQRIVIPPSARAA